VVSTISWSNITRKSGAGSSGPIFHFLMVGALLCCYLSAVVSAEEAKTTPVSTTHALEQDIQRPLNLTGTVTAAQAARLSVATSGLVTTIYVDAGSKVEAGELLLELDPELAQLQLDSSKAQVEQAGTALKDAKRRLEEAQRLIPQRSIAESVVRDIEAEVASDGAALHQAQADAGYREGILLRHQLRAPFAGVVSAKLTETGEWINPGQAVFDLVAVDDVRLDFSVSEDYLADVRPDAAVSFSLNSDPGKSYPGRVATIVPVTDPNARTFLLRVLANKPGQHMLPGMSVRAVMKLATGRRGLVVPRDAIIRFPDGRVVVWVIDDSANGPTAREQPVSIGLTFDSLVEIREGLETGAVVVTKGNEALQNGQRVHLAGPKGNP
jgi:membrane fusion protein (multidrug efflux system)